MVKVSIGAGNPIEVSSLEDVVGLVQSEEFYRAIGEFIFWFSHLESHMKARLAGALDLDRELFDIIIAPYDFATLCTVLSETLKIGASPEQIKGIDEHFNKCRGLNSAARVVIAHGSWTLDGARHVSRQKLKADIYFADPEEIKKATIRTKELMRALGHLDVPTRLVVAKAP